MSYSYSTWVSTGYSAVASYWATRFSVVSGTPSPPPVPTGNEGFLQSFADGLLGVAGFQGQSDALATTSNTTSGTFADIGGLSSWAFVAPMTRWYLLNVDLSVFSSGSACTCYFRVVVGSTNYEISAMRVDLTNVGVRVVSSFKVPVLLTAGSNTIKLQWKTNAAQVNTEADTFRTFTIT